MHYMNKYPGARIHASDDALDVFLGDRHVVAIRKDGAGSIVDRSEELGCRDCHCLSPIPKDSRVHKLMPDGKIGQDELAEERRVKGRRFVKDGKVLSCEELKKHGFQFDEKQKFVAEPQAQAPAAAPQAPAPSNGQNLSL